MTAIIDFDMGNLGSVKRKLDLIGEKSIITDSPVVIHNSDRIILPGVGHFAKAVLQLKLKGLWDCLNYEAVESNKPFLGICLGMQLMAGKSDEGYSDGLGWFDSEVIKFRVKDTLRYKVPHTGWNGVVLLKDSRLFKGIKTGSEFYFVHSYHLNNVKDEEILTKTDYEYTFTSSIERDNLFGVQFHPEKSQDVGEKLLRNFIKI